MSSSQPLVASEVLDAYPIQKHRCLLDVGGGDGSFLIEASKRAEHLKLVLFDLPPVAQSAAQRFKSLGLERDPRRRRQFSHRLIAHRRRRGVAGPGHPRSQR